RPPPPRLHLLRLGGRHRRGVALQALAAERAPRFSAERLLSAHPRLVQQLSQPPHQGEEVMAKELKGSKTHQNLKDAFAGESQANRRYLYFAKVADVEGRPEVAGLFKDTADGETGHAHGHLDYLKSAGDPATGLPIGNTAKN